MPRRQRRPRMARSLRFRAYTGRRSVRRDLRRLIEEFGSSRIDEALTARGLRAADGRRERACRSAAAEQDPIVRAMITRSRQRDQFSM